MNIVDRIQDYSKEYCWQYDIRLRNKTNDLELSGLTEEEVSELKVTDFEFEAHSEEKKKQIWKEAKSFIERHEWLGKMSLYPTHIFTARYKGILSGVVIMDMPNAFSKLLGEDTRKLERLISRGACISWSPKNLASALVMYSIRWMVANTPYRIFTAYSDSEAKEIGTIYQACNFIYLGKESGTKKQYKVPNTDRWISDRSFRARSYYRKYAKLLSIPWDKSWQEKDKIIWGNMPSDIEKKLREYALKYQASCEIREIKPKHKYAYILGKNKGETKALIKLFKSNNPDKVDLPYPKTRGD